MELSAILSPARVVHGATATSKKRALELLSQLLADGQTFPAQDVFECLVSRERLGTTALGHGVALPHARMKKSEHTLGAFVHLAQGVDFDAADRKPVDMLFAIVVPEQSTEEHLQLLARIAEMFSDEATRARLREAGNSEELYRRLTLWKPQYP